MSTAILEQIQVLMMKPGSIFTLTGILMEE